MIQQWRSKIEIKKFEQDIENWWAIHASPLILTDDDEMSVGELKGRDDCPDLVKKYINNFVSTKRVFFKIYGEEWAYSLHKC